MDKRELPITMLALPISVVLPPLSILVTPIRLDACETCCAAVLTMNKGLSFGVADDHSHALTVMDDTNGVGGHRRRM